MDRMNAKLQLCLTQLQHLNVVTKEKKDKEEYDLEYGNLRKRRSSATPDIMSAIYTK